MFLQQKRRDNHLLPNQKWYEAIGFNGTSGNTVQKQLPTNRPKSNASTPKTVTPQVTPTTSPVLMVQTPERHGYRPEAVPAVNYSVPLMDNGAIKLTVATPGNYGLVAKKLTCHCPPALKSRLDSSSIGSAKGAVRFYDGSRHPPNYYLSNTYIHRERGQEKHIKIDGFTYPSVEHYFQCMKFKVSLLPDADERLSKAAFDEIRSAPSGGQAKEISRARRHSGLVDYKQWDHVHRDNVMFRGISEKFNQHGELRQKLHNTWPNVIIEDTKNDRYWGNSGDDTGANMTGQILGLVRKQNRQQMVQHS